jgi:alkylated DNA nucleotide flippase Atl1
MASTRAAEVAEVLWEIKRADKLATYSDIAIRAGFSPGANGRAIMTALRSIRQDWPHLQWWRAIKDDGAMTKGCEQEEKLRQAGYELTDGGAKTDVVKLAELQAHLMRWDINQAGETPVVEMA